MLCCALYLWTAPGRILFPDDEIVYQTTRALYERGALDIEGIPKRTGELKGRPDGTFGWAPGRNAKRYGFFGHALSLVALPAYAIGKVVAARAPEPWRHAIRSDHYFLHPRSPQQDWPRLVVSLTNVLVTAATVVMLLRWLVALGFALRIATIVALVYAVGTTAWPYTRTFLSEPLSAACLVGALWCIAELHRGGAGAVRWALGAGVFAGVAMHTHVLNLVALPWLAAAAIVPMARPLRVRVIAAGLAPAVVALALLLFGQWWRFGDAFESGRYDHYSWWIAPGVGAMALLFGPGRSVFLFSPPLFAAVLGVREWWRRMPVLACCVLGIAASRWLVVAMRSDWWGGWSIGPRYLVPVVPLLLVPLAIVLERAGAWSKARRIAVSALLAASVMLQLHLSLHSIFEWMLHLTTTGDSEWHYLERSHWLVDASPIVGFVGAPLDTLSTGALRLAKHGHPGFAILFASIAALGLLAAWRLLRTLRR
ncbi:MAG TPA: hypothetical protein VG755_36875 [Nannocystaceae bacterium]|nr:hypothetical protein [Nannocystaceae bacterium]